MPFGDWNDQLTAPGKGGKGESVWTTMAFATALPKVIELANAVGRTDVVEYCTRARKDIEQAIQKHAWNGSWFIRATTDEGKSVGTPDDKYGRIWVLPQAWAILADLATDQQTEAIVKACYEHLLVEHGFLILSPAWEQYDPNIGHLSTNTPGVVENGSNYCHASCFMMYALCKCGKKDEALDIFGRILPVNPANPPSRSHQEPFSITNTYRGPGAGGTAGRSMFSWRTGTAGWMFCTAVEGILGVRAELDGLRIDGKIPSNWDKAELKRRYRGKDVTVRFKRTGTKRLTVDGSEVPGPVIPAEMISPRCLIECEM